MDAKTGANAKTGKFTIDGKDHSISGLRRNDRP